MKPKHVVASLAVLIIGASVAIYSWMWVQPQPSQIENQPSQDNSGFGEIVEQLNVAPVTPTPTPRLVLKDLPASKNLSKGIQVFQTFNNCGPSSLSMALSHYGISETQAVLGQSLRPWQNAAGDNDDKSVTLAELAIKAEDYGLISYHRPAGTIEIVKHFINYDMPVVTRTWLHPGEDIGHYRVITGFDDTQGVFIQDDSLQGAQLQYEYQDYVDLWQAFNYEFLVLVPQDKVEIAEAILDQLLDEEASWQIALDLANQQISQNPQDLYALFNKSVALYHLGQYQEAIQVYETIEARLPFRMLWYQNEPILAYYKNENYDRVLSISDQILNNHNRAYAELHQLRGQIYETRGQVDLAQQAFALADQYGADGEYWRVNLK